MRGPCKEWVTSRASVQEAGKREKGASLGRSGSGGHGAAGLPRGVCLGGPLEGVSPQSSGEQWLSPPGLE